MKNISIIDDIQQRGNKLFDSLPVSDATSFVSAEALREILEICYEHLGDRGLAFVRYDIPACWGRRRVHWEPARRTVEPSWMVDLEPAKIRF